MNKYLLFHCVSVSSHNHEANLRFCPDDDEHGLQRVGRGRGGADRPYVTSQHLLGQLGLLRRARAFYPTVLHR